MVRPGPGGIEERKGAEKSMEQKVCSLCEGKIVDGRCRDCGMNYRKMEGRYFLNRDRAEREKPAVERDKGGQNARSGGAKSQLIIGGILALFALVPAIVPMFENLKSEPLPETASKEIFYENEIEPLPDIPNIDEIMNGDEDADIYADVYANATRPLNEEGEELHEVLSAGRYIVGCHIPEGNYRVVGPGTEDSGFCVDDKENGIFHYWRMFNDGVEKTDGYEVMDVRLYDGAIVQLEGRSHLQFYTENGQTSAMKSAQSNPLTEEVEVGEEIQRAGEDFEPGIYDIVVEGDIVHVVIDCKDGWEDRYMLDGCNVEAPQRFNNIEIPQGADIHMERVSGSEWKMILVPSEEVFTDPE